MLPEDPPEIDLDDADVDIKPDGLEITGMRTLSGTATTSSKFSRLFSSSDDENSSGSEGSYDEDEAGRDPTLSRAEGEHESDDRKPPRPRRQSTTEAKTRTPLDDDDDDDDDDLVLARDVERKMALGQSEGPFADPDDGDDSSEDELVEIKTRRKS